MDNNILNNLVLYKGKWFSDLIDTAKISAASQQNPYQVATVLSYVFGTKDNGYNTSLDMLTGGLGNVMTIDKFKDNRELLHHDFISLNYTYLVEFKDENDGSDKQYHIGIETALRSE